MSEAAIEAGIIDRVLRILELELVKEDMDDDMASTALSILDSVKTLLAKEGGVQLVCSRLELLLGQQAAGELNADDSEVDNIMKQACDLLIIVLTGDDAMDLLYNNGVGEVYLTMVQWLDSGNSSLLTTAVLAIGNFARKDAYCIHMMNDHIYEKLLDIFEVYHNFAVKTIKNPNEAHPIDTGTLTKVQHAVLSALRNLSVPAANKRAAAAGGRAMTLFLAALPHVKDHHVAYKLLAAIRMLVDGQESVARQFASNHSALTAAAMWGAAVEHAGAAGEAPRLLAWTVRQLRHTNACQDIMQVDGCISCLVNMLVSSHSVMQNEAILSLTLLAIDVFNNKTPQTEHPPMFNYEKNFMTQLEKSEIGKHVSLLIDSNCAKMPIEVAENLLAFLDITAKKNELAHEYRNAKVHESLQKLTDSRHDFSDSLIDCAKVVASMISDTDKLQ
ncbi:Rap1 GTPase-GDP dissociation stimulator 1-A [Eumeta japonica]|uniref:Rap1 GTPase-GDP dissociation stimulator 1-A n=1 Tax=Eumeta variegata TaxID=151549 RepID=A0A4C1W6B8_EUMVA|nr:Rap1 GTPase-GDP dissociation stimulator 1-A [Eumeta japonica]